MRLVTLGPPALLASLLGLFALDVAAAGEAAAAPPGLPPLLSEMSGTWNVEQTMWPAAGSPPVRLPPAVARRRVVNDAFVEEVMEATQGEPFTRVAYLAYNTVDQQYEYFSLDTRAPQMMTERSAGPRAADDAGALVLYGGMFVAAEWGSARDAPFRYRLVVEPVRSARQRVRLYLLPLSGSGRAAEFLAFEYVYTRAS